MPKITRDTVEEHRAAQHRAVLDAAGRLIEESSGQVPSLGEVAAQVGLARSSVYAYASSRVDLVIQLLLETIPAWTARVSAAIDAAGDDPGARVDTYLEHTLDFFVDGTHGPLMAAAQQHPEAFTDERVVESHELMAGALRAAIADLPSDAVPLLDAAVHRGAEMITRDGVDRDRVLGMLQRMARGLMVP